MDRKELRKFGIIMASVLFIWGGLFYWRGKDGWLYFIIFASLFFISGLLFPIFLMPIKKILDKLTLFLGLLVTRLILIILLYMVITPISFIALLVGKKFLDLKFNKNNNTDSYWIPKKEVEFTQDAYEKQF